MKNLSKATRFLLAHKSSNSPSLHMWLSLLLPDRAHCHVTRTHRLLLNSPLLALVLLTELVFEDQQHVYFRMSLNVTSTSVTTPMNPQAGPPNKKKLFLMTASFNQAITRSLGEPCCNASVALPC